jgi:MSHA biogenesis protein MshJ
MAIKHYAEKFLQLSLREQSLILITGIVLIVMVPFSVFIDGNLGEIKHLSLVNNQLQSTNRNLNASISELQLGLQQDPNAQIKQDIAAYTVKLKQLDQSLLSLTSELINPVEMRNALSELLKLQKGVSLVSFEVLPASPINLVSNKVENTANVQTAPLLNTNEQNTEDKNKTAIKSVDSLALYRHGIKIKLTGKYFQLRNYLQQLEKLSWKFYWQQFDYKLKRYPMSELEIEMYSLSTKKDFIGV